MGLFSKDDHTLTRIAQGRTDLVFDHIARGGVPDAQSDGAPLIRWCARYGDVSAIRFLVANGESLESLGANFGLGDAAYFGHWRLCEFLLENGADVDAAEADTGETALHSALCTANRPAFDLVVKVLLAAGANPNTKTKPGVETGAFMRDCRTKGETPLHRAAAFGGEDAIRMLLDAGAARNVTDSNGDSPLSWASWHTRPDAILRLLCYGDFHVRADRNSTFDHGLGWGFMERDLLGTPHTG